MRTVRGRGPRVVAVFLLGILLAQAAWILAVPPFRGMDEFDHAFLAAGVASGQWRLHDEAAAGRGLLVEVPADLVTASRGQCESLPYIESETCDGDGPGHEGSVLATTSAAGYVPVYYWVVGTAGEPFSGAGSLYAMRIASALMCAIVLAVALLCATTWVRGPWALIGLLTGLTPTVLYTSTVVAPNGLEIVAGVCLWSALLGLGRARAAAALQPRTERWLLAAVGLSSVLLLGLRTLGPLWVVLIVVSVTLLRGPRAYLDVVTRHRAPVAMVMGSAAVTGVAVLLWNRGNVAFAEGALNGEVDSSWTQVVRWPTWVLQSIGAFPYRDQPAPIVVHLLVLLVVVTALVAAVRRGSGQERVAVSVAALLCLVVPSVLVAVTLADRGGVWQGRYSLPFAVGVMLLIGLVLDRARWQTHDRDVRPQLLAVVMLAVAQVVSVVHVQRAELDREVSAMDPGWTHPPLLVTGVVMTLAWMLLALATVRRPPAGAATGADLSASTVGVGP